VTTVRGNPCEFQGRAAARQGQSLAACPYPEGTPQGRAWRAGYEACRGAAALILPVRPVNQVAANGAEKRDFRDGQAWRAEDDALLIDLWRQKVSVPEIAARLRRSDGAVTGRAMHLRQHGYDLPSRRRVPHRTGSAAPRQFSAEDDRRLLAMHEKFIPDWSIAEKLGFPVWRVRQRAEMLLRCAARRRERQEAEAGAVGSEWSARDAARAWDMATRLRLSALEIAAELGRSERAVWQKLCRLRGKFRTVAGKRAAKAAAGAPAKQHDADIQSGPAARRFPLRWTAALDDELLRLWNVEKRNEREIATALGTTRTAVMARKRALRDRGIHLEERRGKLAGPVRKETARHGGAAPETRP
jgi:biotin operon repressor